MITKSDIHDEAKRRVLDLVGGHRGGDLALKAMQVLFRHAASPNNQTRAQIHGVLALIDCCNRLEKAMPDDYKADRWWRIPETPVVVDRQDGELRARVQRLEAMLQAVADRPQQLTIQHVPTSVIVERDKQGHSPDIPNVPIVLRRQVETFPDIETAERETLADIQVHVEAACERMPMAMAQEMANKAAQMAVALRTAQTLDEIEQIRDGVLAFVEQTRAAA